MRALVEGGMEREVDEGTYGGMEGEVDEGTYGGMEGEVDESTCRVRDGGGGG